LGGEAQIDWYEGWVQLDGVPRKMYVFCMRSMASGGAFHRAYSHATQQAFLEAHELAFAYFAGVFRLLRYDNLKSAVKKILRGHQREERARFIGFRSHWGFTSEFCTPGEGHAKGGVEGEGGQFRRNFLVPVPSVQSLEELNLLLLSGSVEEQSRVITGRTQTIGAAMLIKEFPIEFAHAPAEGEAQALATDKAGDRALVDIFADEKYVDVVGTSVA